jgi:DNA modification methylase
VSITIRVGDCREVLATLPAESVQCVVTSPPYWGLRDYGLPPTVWGGEDPGCAHAWGQETYETRAPYGVDFLNPQGASMGSGKREGGTVSHGAVCARCGAWQGSLGLEPDPALYVAHLVEVFRAARRVLRSDGVCFVNLGDSYASGEIGRHDGYNPTGLSHKPFGERRQSPLSTGLKPKDLVGIPWRVAFALQADAWWLRSEIIWHKPNPMPESVTDRPTKAHEQLFLLTKNATYYYDAEAIKESGTGRNRGNTGPDKGAGHGDPYFRTREGFAAVADTEWFSRNKRSVWTIPSAPFSEAHFATFPPALVEPCVQAGTSERGACPACGAPWRRAVERGELVPDAPMYKPRGTVRGDALVKNAMVPAGAVTGHPNFHYEQRTLGWAPTCACAPQPVPCVVLDPFAGAGTVGLVADRLGRDAILIDLSPAYAAMAERRIREEAPLLTAVEVEAAAPAARDNGHGRAAPEQLALWR